MPRPQGSITVSSPGPLNQIDIADKTIDITPILSFLRV